MSPRDDFSKPTIRKIAQRVSYLCSNPHCRRHTIGAATGHDGVQNVGVASHITAAAPGGPRYDSSLKSEERRHHTNGIWLCQTHGKLVDGDDKQFTVELLLKWKRDAEERSMQALLGLGETAERATTATQRAEATRTLGERLGTEADHDIEALLARVRAAAERDIATFKASPGWPREAVSLNLRIKDRGETRGFHVAGLAAAAEAFDEFTIIAPPGTGKSTTLLQVTEAIVAGGRSIGIFVPLGELSVSGETLLAAIAARHAFREVATADLALLADNGRLVLALDGWNELDNGSRRRIAAEVARLKRDHPQLGLVVSTRREALDVPIGGRTIEIEYLNDTQQRTIARAYRGDGGETLLDAARRTPGISELMAIPLYLTALLIAVKDDRMPETREEVLRLFVRQHEEAPDRARALRDVSFGFHGDMLKALAVEATRSANTAISDSRARSVVKAVEDRLAADGQITFAPQPTAILDTLVSQHTLVRSGTDSLSFQHQQFQEWYASFDAERAMRETASGGAESKQRFRAEILDDRSWEEALLFACERVSREGKDGVRVIAHTVRAALTVDPMLAGEMIFRSSEAVWHEVAEEVQNFVKQWRRPGDVDRAVRFMVISGRPEFAETIWPFITSADSQVYLSVIRVARRFRPSVLGADAAKRLAAVPATTRHHVLADLVMHGTLEAIRLVASVAKSDPEPEVRVEMVQALLFRRADKLAGELLSQAPDAIWDQLAKRGYDETELRVAGAAEKLAAARIRLLAVAKPSERIGVLLRHGEISEADSTAIEDNIAAKDFSPRDEHAASTLYRVAERLPEVARRAILRRLEAGLELPYGATEHLALAPPLDDGPVAALILDPSAEDRRALAAAHVAGPETARILLDRMIAATERLHSAPENARDAPLKELSLWQGRLVVAPVQSVLSAILARKEDDPPHVIGEQAEIVARHGSRDQDKPPLDVGNLGDELAKRVGGWSKRMIADQTSRRGHLAWVGKAIGRLGRPELLGDLKALRDEDARRRRNLLAAVRTPQGRADIRVRSDAATIWSNWYRDAFAQMGAPAAPVMIGYLEDEAFGFDAAYVLKLLDDRRRGIEKPSLFRTWPYFDGVAARRAERDGGVDPARGDTAYADAIFAAIERLIAQGSTDGQQRLAIAIARLAISMSHADCGTLMDRLLALPQPIGSKRELIAAIVIDGGMFCAALGLRAVDEWIAAAQKDSWRLRDYLFEVIGWLELLPFSDRPLSVMEGLQRVLAVVKYPEQMGRVVTAMAQAPGLSDAELADVFGRFPRLVSQHEWAQAFLGRGTPSAARVVIDLVAKGGMARGPGAADTWWLAREIGKIAQQHSGLKNELIERFANTAPGPAYHLLERIFEDVAGPQAVLALVHSYGKYGRKFGGSLPQALYHTALDHVPVDGSTNVFNLVPVSLGPLRKALFDLTSGEDALAAVATETLHHIDRLRDSSGGADEEPRHPDVASRRAWPLLTRERGEPFQAHPHT